MIARGRLWLWLRVLETAERIEDGAAWARREALRRMERTAR